MAVQDEVVHALEGEMTHLVEQVLLSFFNNQGYDLRTGLAYDLKGYGPLMLVMCLELIIADIKALVEAVGSNGPTAMLPCFCCERVVSYDSKQRPPLDTNDGFVTLSCLEHAQMGKRTSDNVRQTLQRMAANRAKVTATTMLQKDADTSVTWNGYKHIPNNFLLNRSLSIDVISCIVFDWMHLMFQTGCWNREVWAFF